MPKAHVPNWPDIWFLRHGQTEWNLAGRIQGRLDSPLTALGRAQANSQAALIADIAARVATGPGNIYVSPLGRARETAALALPEYDAVIDPRLAEIDTGAWEGLAKADLPQGSSDLLTYAAAPDGEGLEELIGRVRGFAEELAGPSIIVAHGLWGQVLRGLAKGLPQQNMGAQDNRQGCVYHLSNGSEDVLGNFTG
ncbi:histidine phosphatase family protein [Roseovarius sp. Pro17]|uniref:histidine phosphatase family protein n=1 Tax=Roseovarius sp. Pro17 TaxID=3108175 RepID=UPI002D7804BB|nr:histidine phosphatase family protein [Roseovarius sp. Pro17]